MQECKLELAHKYAKYYHRNDMYGDEPYYDRHLCGVFNSVKDAGYSEEYQKVALLHDIHEDHSFPIDLLISIFGYNVGMAVDAISYRKGHETKQEYWRRCGENKIACVVKRFDAEFNSNSSYEEGDEKRGDHYAGLSKLMIHYLNENFKGEN